MKKLLLIQVMLATILAVLSGAAMGAGRLNAESRSPVRRNAFCELPCWRGIQPGETFTARANRIMLAQGFTAQATGSRINYLPPDDSSACMVSMQSVDAVVTSLHLNACPALQLGDVLLELDQPYSLAPNQLTFAYENGSVRVQLYPPACNKHLSPYAKVQFITLTSRQADLDGGIQARWQGFALPWRYMRAMPTVVVLAC
ncbi:MAG: hypothetical protein CL610_01580 [Anaerolineaceae bacterium]|nr:hypothetical protein [Anaerolineaceae bacterium]